AGAAFGGYAADNVEDHRSLRQVPPGQLLLDVVLTAEQPIHRRVQFLAVGIADAEFLGQGGGVPVAGRGELGTREQQALGNQGQDEGPLTGGFGSEQGFKAEQAAGSEARLDMAGRAALCGAEGYRWGDAGSGGGDP